MKWRRWEENYFAPIVTASIAGLFAVFVGYLFFTDEKSDIIVSTPSVEIKQIPVDPTRIRFREAYVSNSFQRQKFLGFLGNDNKKISIYAAVFNPNNNLTVCSPLYRANGIYDDKSNFRINGWLGWHKNSTPTTMVEKGLNRWYLSYEYSGDRTIKAMQIKIKCSADETTWYDVSDLPD